MDQLLRTRGRREDLETRIAEEHARHRLRLNERIDFLERLGPNGQSVLVPVIRRRLAAGRLSGNG